MNNFEKQFSEPETSVESVEGSVLEKTIGDFLESKGVDSSFRPVVDISDKGYLSVEIYKDGKSVFNGYSTAEPFRVGKEKIIEGAKEAIGYWLDSQSPIMEDMNDIKDHTASELEKFKLTGKAREESEQGRKTA
ncbi:hypothetical protein K9M47_02915 [Candidatus Gracilibacteria bacterium]|nr:hypothetical protein [Candidatus Gracilibacteria bacterium]